MKCFTDSASRRHTITINVFAIKRCRALLGVDLYGLVSGGFESLGKLLSDPVMLVDVLFVLCEPDKNNPPVSDEDFGRAMGGDVLEQAAQAFMEELSDFFPEPQRAGLKKLIQKTRQMEQALATHNSLILDEIDVEQMAAIEIAKAKARALVLKSQNGQNHELNESSDSSGISRESSGLIQDHLQPESLP
jgi:hypothetical protein